MSTRKADAGLLYSYSTSSLSKKDLVRFFYALKGRDGGSGILKATRSEFLAKGALLVPFSKATELEEFFRFWKVPAKRRRGDFFYTYSTSSLAKKDLVRFFYALKGRDGGSGILKAIGAEFLAKGVLLVPASKVPQVDEFFKLWKVPVKKRRLLLDD